MASPIYDGQVAVYPQAAATQTLQDQQIAAQMGMQGMKMYGELQENQAILVQQTNPNKIIDDVIFSLRGIEKKDDGSLKQVSEPQVNDFGLGRIRVILRSVINQNTILSHLEKEDIGRIMIALSNDVTDELTLSWKEFGIKEKAQLDTIADAILIPAFLALKRAEGQNEKNWLGKISFENLNNAPRIQQPKKESWLSKFKL